MFVSVVTVLVMNESNKPAKDMESIGDAASRLLAGLDDRRKQVSGDLERPERIEDSPRWSRVGEETPKAAERGGVSLKAFGVVTCRGVVQQGLELNVLRVHTHANDDDLAWLEW